MLPGERPGWQELRLVLLQGRMDGEVRDEGRDCVPDSSPHGWPGAAVGCGSSRVPLLSIRLRQRLTDLDYSSYNADPCLLAWG